MNAPSPSSIHELSCLADWLGRDAGDITDLSLAERLETLMRRIERESPQPWPSYIREFQGALELIRETNDSRRRLKLSNEALRRLFVDSTLTEESYRNHTQDLETGDELAHRRASRNPLPTMDAMIHLVRDPRHLSQCDRAAVLTRAMLETRHVGTQILGTTLVPGETVDELVESAQPMRILVLSHGVAYTVALEGSTVASLRDDFAAIQADAADFASQPESWTRVVPALVTAAARTTCHRVRCLLEQDEANARALAVVDRCHFAVCLDQPCGVSPAMFGELEAASRLLFRQYENRWFGMACLVVSPDAEAAVILSYTRGLEAVPSLAFADSLLRRSVELPLPTSAPVPMMSAARIEFRKVDLGALEAQASSETTGCFHDEQAFFSLDTGSTVFQSMGVSPNAAMQYLLMLAASETFPADTPPAFSHAVSTHNGARLKGGLDWVMVSSVPMQNMAGAADGALFEHWRDAVREHSAKVVAARVGYSPTSFVRSPSSTLDQLLYSFFLEIGSEFETAYRSYLFRATRWEGTMDILTSTLKLPSTVRYCGRPGATNEVAGMFGLHLVIEPECTHLFFIPRRERAAAMKQLHASMERLTIKLKAAAAVMETPVCA